MNKVSLIGRLTKDVELRYTQTSNIAVASFTLAVNRRIKQGEQQADFINIVAWGKTAEFCTQYFNKGQQVAVVGRIQTRTYENEKGKQYITEVVAEEVYFADSKKGDTDEGMNIVFNDVPSNNDDDLPF